MSLSLTAQRIRDLLEHDPFGGCAFWPRAVTGEPRGGYGLIRVNGVWQRVHRIICEDVHGPPPRPDAIVLHRCDRRPCAADHHVRWGTQSENTYESWVRTRPRKVEKWR